VPFTIGTSMPTLLALASCTYLLPGTDSSVCPVQLPADSTPSAPWPSLHAQAWPRPAIHSPFAAPKRRLRRQLPCCSGDPNRPTRRDPIRPAVKCASPRRPNMRPWQLTNALKVVAEAARIMNPGFDVVTDVSKLQSPVNSRLDVANVHVPRRVARIKRQTQADSSVPIRSLQHFSHKRQQATRPRIHTFMSLDS
jgi:hypothetical protein